MNHRALVTLCLTMISTSFAADDMPARNQEVKSLRGTLNQSFELQYLLFLPRGHNDDAEKRWPLLLFLHGAGERGNEISKVAVHGPPNLVKQGKDFPFILVSPQCPSGRTWSDQELLALIAEVVKEQRVDPSRIYLTGLSMGGYGTWSLGTRHPDLFAAIAPICGGGDILPILLPPLGNHSALRRLPVWAFHGAKDDVVRVVESERMVDALRRIGNTSVKLTVYPEATHDSWTETYNNPEFYEWLLQQKRPRPSASMRRKLGLSPG